MRLPVYQNLHATESRDGDKALGRGHANQDRATTDTSDTSENPGIAAVGRGQEEPGYDEGEVIGEL